MSNLARGDMGDSLAYNQPVTQLIGQRLMLTVAITMLTLLLTYAIAIPIGIYSATHQYSLTDYAITVFGFIGLATPNFLFAGFFATHDTLTRFSDFALAAPQRIRLLHDGRLQRPFVYGLETTRDPETYRKTYVEDGRTVFPIRFLVHGDPYKLLGLLRADLRFAGVEAPGTLFLFGTDRLGRDMFSRTLAGARVSLTIGLLGVAISFVVGCLLGGLSGYFGGPLDTLIQRVIEFLGALPTLPVWMALAEV